MTKNPTIEINKMSSKKLLTWDSSILWDSGLFWDGYTEALGMITLELYKKNITLEIDNSKPLISI